MWLCRATAVADEGLQCLLCRCKCEVYSGKGKWQGQWQGQVRGLQCGVAWCRQQLSEQKESSVAAAHEGREVWGAQCERCGE